MNTTFTNYAEKKAKQFFNLLQGYTKGIRITAILILLLIGVSNAWAWNVEEGKVFYFKPSSAWGSDNARFAVAFGDGNNTYAWQSCTAVPGESGVYYIVSPGNYNWMILCRMKPNSTNDWSNRWNECNKVEPNSNYNKFDMKSDWGQDFNWYKYAPPMESASITNTSTVYGGDGTEGNPYQIKKGTNISVSATATSAVTADNQTKYYKFYKKENSGSRTIVGSESTTTTSSFTASSTVGTKYAVDVEARNEYYSNYGKKATSSTLYYITIEPIYAILGSFNDWTHSANTWDLSDQGSNIWKATFHLDKGSHTFKVVYNSSYYGKNNTTITRASATASSLSTSGANINLTTDIAGNYTFIFNSSNKNLSVTYPEAYKVTFSKGTGGKTVTAKVDGVAISSGDYVLKGKSVVFTQEAETGYTFSKWTDGSGNQISTATSYTCTVTADVTVKAEFTENTTNVTIDANERSLGTLKVGGAAQDWGYSTSVGVATTKSIAATPKDNSYEFTGWTLTGNVTTSDDTKNTTITIEGNGNSGSGTVTANFQKIVRTITFDQEGGEGDTETLTATYGEATTQITPPTKTGYIFGGYWTGDNGTGTQIVNTDGTWIASIANFTDANNKWIVTSNITLYAKWVAYENCVFFKNNLDWGEVYVYTFSNNAWYDTEDPNTEYGPGVCPQVNKLEIGKKMTRIGDSDVYYYVMTNISSNHTQDNNANKNYIAFANKDMSTYKEFYGAEAVWRGDHKNNLTFFIPQLKEYQISQGTVKEVNQTKYYNKGLWMKYNSTESGYQIATNNNAYDTPPGLGTDDGKGWETHGNKLTTQTPGGYTFSITKTLNANTTYEFKIHNYMWVIDHEGRENNQWFGDDGTLTNDNCTKWGLIYEENQETKRGNTKIKTTIAGDYTFNIYLGDGRVILSVDYPLSVGDYQLWYTDGTYGNGQYHKEERIIKKCSTGSRKDTISFFVRKDKNPEVLLYRCSNIDGDTKTWAPVETLSNIIVDSTSVYNFVIEQTNEDTHQASFTGDYFLHTGDFYIRTDAADGGWKNYSQDSHRFTYSSYADEHEDFSHYFCKWVTVNNVKFNVATDYSETLCSSMAADPIDADPRIVTDINGNLPNNNGVNVRFGWNCHTNQLTRAYLAGASTDYFLRIIDAENLKKQDGTNVTDIQFEDLQNWIYQLDVKATASTKIKLVADYADKRQYFKGATQKVGLLGSTATTEYDIRLIYNFKTNHLVAAMILGGDDEVTTDETLGADMMVIRKDQGYAEQLTFNPNSKQLAEVGTVYAVMTFTSNWINGTAGARERSLYWVSFPFDVKVSDVFGFGEYGEEWILQYYDGAERAEKGLFGDSGTYWKYIEDTKTTLNAGTGYVLALDLSKVKFLHGATEVSLYFPSTEPVESISGDLPTAAPVPEHWCNIDREWTENGTTYHHKWTDSHWNLIGVPGFADIDFNLSKTGYHFMQNDASFYYNFKLAESTYAVEASHVTEFQAMYAYMVQFAGTIDWTSSTVVGATPTEPKLAARRYSDEQPEKVVLCLELAQGEEEADRTFIQLQQEGATANFDLSLDLTKIMNSGFSNIYTLTDSLKIQVAGNALPMEETVVPVGVNIATAGEYTFSMPDGTEGMVVELIDYERDITTNLLLFDYTVTLPAGSNESRFALHIQPNKSGVTTGVENVGDKAKGIGKYLIDGKLIIRTAEGVFDAQGKRL